MELSLEKIMKDKILVTFDEEGKNYVLPKNKVLTKNTLFTTLLECSDKDKLLVHNEKTFTYEQFNVINKILNNEKLTASELKENEDILKYYLIDNKDSFRISADAETDKFLFYNTEKKYSEALEYIKDNKLPYLPFKASFAKGTSEHLPSRSNIKEKENTPMYISFSEYNNIFLFRQIIKLYKEVNQEKLYEYNTKRKIYSKYGKLISFPITKPYDEKINLMKESMEFLFENYYDHYDHTDYKSFAKTFTKHNLYCIDSENKLFIHPSYTKKILEYLEKIDFYNSLIKESENEDINIFTKDSYPLDTYTRKIEYKMCVSEVYGFVKCDDFVGSAEDKDDESNEEDYDYEDE
jgi:hypothetical protein